MKTNVNFLTSLCSILLRRRNVPDKVVEYNQTHILFSIDVFENRAVYKKIRKNIVEWGMPQLTIWRIRIACWTTKATNTHSEYNTYSFSTATIVARTPLLLR
jgi:hypothetical protein